MRHADEDIPDRCPRPRTTAATPHAKRRSQPVKPGAQRVRDGAPLGVQHRVVGETRHDHRGHAAVCCQLLNGLDIHHLRRQEGPGVGAGCKGSAGSERARGGGGGGGRRGRSSGHRGLSAWACRALRAAAAAWQGGLIARHSNAGRPAGPQHCAHVVDVASEHEAWRRRARRRPWQRHLARHVLQV
jgi:hypothetical protein